MEKVFDIISPDGFPIHPEKTYKQEEVLPAFEAWKSRYAVQGYYSSVTFGRISLYDLDDYCEVVEVTERGDDSAEAEH